MSNASAETLFPYVVPAGYVDWVDSGMWRSWPVSEDVAVALVFDCDGLVRNARPEELEELGLDEGEAFDRAAENLAKAYWDQKFDIGHAALDDGVEIACAQGSWMAPAAGLIFRTFYEKMQEQFGANEFIGIALNQELLIAFPPDERTLASRALQNMVEDRFANHRKPISRSWLLLDGGWPRGFSGNRTF